jgi:cell division septal protein FtsQ
MAVRKTKAKVEKRAIRPVKKRGAVRVRKPRNRSFNSISSKALPLFLSFCILVCLAVIGYFGYQTVAASEFFQVSRIEVYGTERASKENIERLVAVETERTGVLNTDLAELRARIERLPFVETAAVSRVLPNGIRVQIVEKLPVAIVRLRGGDFLVDSNGTILAPIEGNEEKIPFPLVGWDEAKSEQADKENLARLRIFTQMLDEWRDLGIATRIERVDLTNLKDPRAVTEDSGEVVSIAVGRTEFGENLMKGMKAIAGRGDRFDGVDLRGTMMILSPRKSVEK